MELPAGPAIQDLILMGHLAFHAHSTVRVATQHHVLAVHRPIIQTD
jgi:hypothetical protein